MGPILTTKVSVMFMYVVLLLYKQSKTNGKMGCWDVAQCIIFCLLQVPDMTCPYLLSPFSFSIEVYIEEPPLDWPHEVNGVCANSQLAYSMPGSASQHVATEHVAKGG